MKKITMLGGISYQEFLQNYWQKKPLLIRQAFPDFQNSVKKNDLFSLAYQDDMQSRLVLGSRKTWDVIDGPFTKAQFRNMPEKWTLLVQGVNHVVPEVQDVLNKFNFIPHARLDDVMISYASSGGGVGPHVDSYDVFLLQAEGRRLWQISDQQDQTLIANCPLKILKNFKPEQEWLLEPGDMLYLPPNYAHHGVAVGECMTYSIGFRAPSYQELTTEFLGYLQEQSDVNGIYQDPDLQYTKQPALLPNEMIQKVGELIRKIQIDQKNIEIFLGIYLTQPKAHIIFDAPEDPLTKIQFLKNVKKKGVALHAKTQMLFTKSDIFINGEKIISRSKNLRELANKRAIDTISEEITALLYEWYLDGYIISKNR